MVAISRFLSNFSVQSGFTSAEATSPSYVRRRMLFMVSTLRNTAKSAFYFISLEMNLKIPWDYQSQTLMKRNTERLVGNSLSRQIFFFFAIN